MKFNANFILGTAVVLNAVAGVAVFSAPAQAFTLTGENSLVLSGSARFSTASGVLDFQDLAGNYSTPTGIAIITPSSTGRFRSLLGQLATLTDISLTSSLDEANVWEYTGPALDNFITVGAVGYSLSTFRLVKDTTGNWLGTVEGQFQDTTLPGNGIFDPNLDEAFASTTGNGSPYTFSIEEVPTPALLPGLIGMGVAALRRKKDETAEENA